jgi:gamma-glutamyltranspeptidase/glutathione hydrolase
VLFRSSHDESSTPTGKKMAGGGIVTLELRIPNEVRQQLVDMGHKVRPGVNHHGSFQGIWRKNEPLRYFGGSDPRMDGCAIGY